MRTKLFMLMTVAGLIISLSGCGTIGARATTMDPPPFAGLRADFGTFGEILTNKQQIEPLWYWLGLPLVSGIIVADIPTSAVFDLYCLPVDLTRKDRPEKSDIHFEKTNEEDVQGSSK